MTSWQVGCVHGCKSSQLHRVATLVHGSSWLAMHQNFDLELIAIFVSQITNVWPFNFKTYIAHSIHVISHERWLTCSTFRASSKNRGDLSMMPKKRVMPFLGIYCRARWQTVWFSTISISPCVARTSDPYLTRICNKKANGILSSVDVARALSQASYNHCAMQRLL